MGKNGDKKWWASPFPQKVGINLQKMGNSQKVVDTSKKWELSQTPYETQLVKIGGHLFLQVSTKCPTSVHQKMGIKVFYPHKMEIKKCGQID